MKKKYKALLYTTKQKPYLVKRNIFEGVEPAYFTFKESIEDNLNGKICAECDYEAEDIEFYTVNGDYVYLNDSSDFLWKDSCMSLKELHKYFKAKEDGSSVGKAVHIKNLHMFDEPKELSEYYGLIPKKINDFNGSCYVNVSIDNAPKNMMYAIDDNDREYIIISVSPQEMCRIANKEQTVLVRKRVLKEMLK